MDRLPHRAHARRCCGVKDCEAAPRSVHWHRPGDCEGPALELFGFRKKIGPRRRIAAAADEAEEDEKAELDNTEERREETKAKEASAERQAREAGMAVALGLTLWRRTSASCEDRAGNSKGCGEEESRGAWQGRRSNGDIKLIGASNSRSNSRSDRAPGVEATASTPNSSDERPRRKKAGRRRGEREKGESHEEIRGGSISWSAKTWE